MGDLRVTISQEEADEYRDLKANRFSPANSAARQIVAAYEKARLKHAPMRGPHEGYAVLLEEVDELWDEVKRWQPSDKSGDFDAMRKEVLHVAAMALAFMIEAMP